MPPSVEIITLSELRRRIAARPLSKADLETLFEPDAKKSKPFAPALKLSGRVDKEGKRPSARTVTRLYFDAEDKLSARPPAGGAHPSITALAGKMKVLAEGDSWFRLPFFYPDDLLDVLRKTYDIPKVAMWGDEMADMVGAQSKNYMQPLKSGVYRHFLFSGGGNDVLASVGDHIRRFGSAGTDPADASSYIKQSFKQDALDPLLVLYETLAGQVRQITDRKPVLFVHGYARALPRPGGEYIGAKLEALGFDVTGSLAKKIVAEMVDRFNERLKAFADAQTQAHPAHKVVYVNLRPAFTAASDWHTDEIHPSDAGAAKAAAIMAAKISATVPVA